jgi:hypothetical protein
VRKLQKGERSNQSGRPAANNKTAQINIINLADVPIEKPFEEKRLVELDHDSLLRYIRRVAAKGPVLAHARDLRNRIVEIYRMSYEASPTATRESVIRDFAASFPDLVFESDWLRVLVAKQWTQYNFDPAGPRSRLFRALANGFRSAAKYPSFKRLRSRAALGAARFFRKELQSDLDSWNASLERSSSKGASEWIATEAASKAEELVKSYPNLRHLKGQIAALLRKKRLYQASALISSVVLDIRESNLRQKVD